MYGTRVSKETRDRDVKRFGCSVWCKCKSIQRSDEKVLHFERGKIEWRKVGIK